MPGFLLRDAKPSAAAEKTRRPAVAGSRSGRKPAPLGQITPSKAATGLRDRVTRKETWWLPAAPNMSAAMARVQVLSYRQRQDCRGPEGDHPFVSRRRLVMEELERGSRACPRFSCRTRAVGKADGRLALAWSRRGLGSSHIAEHTHGRIGRPHTLWRMNRHRYLALPVSLPSRRLCVG